MKVVRTEFHGHILTKSAGEEALESEGIVDSGMGRRGDLGGTSFTDNFSSLKKSKQSGTLRLVSDILLVAWRFGVEIGVLLRSRTTSFLASEEAGLHKWPTTGLYVGRRGDSGATS